MSGYSDYDDASEHDDAVDEENYAGAFGAIEYPEFNFDDERPLFEFCPFCEYFDLEDENDNVIMTYQALGELAERTAKLLIAWQKRAAAVDHIKGQGHRPMGVQGDDDYSPVPLGLNLYELEMKERSDLRSYSVWRLEMLLGGKEEVMKLKQVFDSISNFVKRIILTSVGDSLPCPMPYPVINTILSYLFPVKGAVNIGLVTADDSKEDERKDMESLYLAMAEVYEHVQMIMFNTVQDSFVTEPSLTGKKEMLVEKFEVLVATVKSTQLQVSFEGLDIKDIGGAEEEVTN